MRWALTQTTKQFHCWKLEGLDFSAEVKYNKEVHSFRIMADDKRLFFIERTGLLQQKFLLKTEYSVVLGETHSRSWESGAAIYKGRKFHYTLKENLFIVVSRKQEVSFAIEIDNTLKHDPFEFCVLLFGTLKIVSKIYKAEPDVAA